MKAFFRKLGFFQDESKESEERKAINSHISKIIFQLFESGYPSNTSFDKCDTGFIIKYHDILIDELHSSGLDTRINVTLVDKHTIRLERIR